MNKQPSLTIGIPAYNEGLNIQNLLLSILSQKLENVSLKEIIVSSDGSTDDTVKKTTSVSDKRIRIIANPDRQGIARGLNQIVSHAKGNILVTLDADICISDPHFLQKLTSPIATLQADLTSSAIYELPPKSFIPRILFVSMRLKNVLFSQFKHGQNIYTCHGLARAYSNKFYSRIQFPVSFGNDMYSYLSCIRKGFKYKFIPQAVAFYQLPQILSDHQNQSLRFFVSEKEQSKAFPADFVRSHTHIPPQDYIISALLAVPILIKYPLESGAYFALQLYLQLRSLFYKSKMAWDISPSSKSL